MPIQFPFLVLSISHLIKFISTSWLSLPEMALKFNHDSKPSCLNCLMMRLSTCISFVYLCDKNIAARFSSVLQKFGCQRWKINRRLLLPAFFTLVILLHWRETILKENTSLLPNLLSSGRFLFLQCSAGGLLSLLYQRLEPYKRQGCSASLLRNNWGSRILEILTLAFQKLTLSNASRPSLIKTR